MPSPHVISAAMLAAAIVGSVHSAHGQESLPSDDLTRAAYLASVPVAAAGTASTVESAAVALAGGSGEPAQSAAAPQERSKPAPTGLERLSDDWPTWVKVGLQYRGRVESAGPSTLGSGPYDKYYLNRLRMRATVAVLPWLSGTAEIQDSQVLDYDAGAVPRNMSDRFDLFQGYLDVTTTRSGTEVLARVGRQQLTFGEGRLIATPDWGNTNRTYDLARVGVERHGVRFDAFGGRVVQTQQGGFNHHIPGERFYGGYAALNNALPKTVLEPYVIVKHLGTAAGELGAAGDADIRTFGARAIVRPSETTEVGVEVAVQRGHQAADPVRAWAEHAIVSWSPAAAPAKLKVSAEYNAASGDDDPADGTRHTFDQLYASNHAKYGLADRIGWRNMRQLGFATQLSPAKKWKVGAGLHHLALATVNDGYYGSSGSRVLLNRSATSRDLGWEADGTVTYGICKELSFSPGLGVLFAGDYLTETTGVNRLWSPYVMWTVKF